MAGLEVHLVQEVETLEKSTNKTKFSLRKIVNKKLPLNRNLNKTQYEATPSANSRVTEQNIRDFYSNTNWG